LLLFLLLLSFVFPAVEEVGLRGYYLDTLQRRLGPTTAGLVNGLVWAAWHAPFVWFPGYFENTTFDPALSWWLPMIVCHTLLIVQVYNGTQRSILAVLIFHGLINFTGEWLRISRDMYPFILSGNVFVALLLIAYWQKDKAPDIGIKPHL
jgi:membrane protease YdiL (CAAX protease family)